MRTRHLPGLLLAAVLPISASAVPVTYEFGGTFNGRMTTVPEWYDFGFPSVADFAGTFTLESETPPEFLSGNVANYGDLVTDVTIRLGPAGSLGTYSGLGGTLYPNMPQRSSLAILNDILLEGSPFDQFGLQMSLPGLAADPANLYRSLFFSGFSYTGDIITNFPDPASLPGPEMFSQYPPQLQLMVTQYADDGAYLRQAGLIGELTTFRPIERSVPEPASWSLMLVGLLALAAARRKAAG
jgi:hypothetical protein